MGPYLVAPITEKKLFEGINKQTKIKFAVGQMQGWRRGMEDDVICETDIGNGNSLFAVFDGHGGFQVSRFLGMYFQAQLTSNENYKDKKYKQALIQVFKRIDQLIDSPQGQQKLKQIRENFDERSESSLNSSNKIGESAGCTANVVLITADYFYIANSGDSRSVLCSQRKAIDLSTDHKPQLASQYQRIKSAGGKIVNGRINGGLNLTRGFGDFSYKRDQTKRYDEQLVICKPEVRQVMRSNKDQFILIGCDGIWQKYVNNSDQLIQKIKKEIDSNQKRLQILQRLLDQLLAKQISGQVGCDNMTMIIIEFL